MHVIRKHGLGILLCMLIILIVISLFLIKQSEEEGGVQTQEEHVDITPLVYTLDNNAQQASDKQSRIGANIVPNSSEGTDGSYNEIPLDIPLPHSTVSDLTEKGFPIMSAPREAAYKQTASQSTTEVVADLGNPFVKVSCRLSQNVYGAANRIAKWGNDITGNLKVLRLIEEGRINRVEISSLLKKEISKCLEDYDTMSDLCKKHTHGLSTLVNVPISESDAYYNNSMRFASPMKEIERIHFTIYSSFYILANIGDLNDLELLSNWIQKQKVPAFECPNMDAWLIDVYYNSSETNNVPSKEEHQKITQDHELSGSHIKMSRWNALWDIHDPLIQARNVDVSDIQTIEVLEIPMHLPVDYIVAEKVISNFLERNKNK